MRRLMRSVLALFLLVLLSGMCLVALGRVEQKFALMADAEMLLPAVPGSILKVTSSEFDGITSDFMFLKAMVFLGGALREDHVTKDEWIWLYRQLDSVTDVDPHFLDPYILAHTFLPWDAGLVAETNLLLRKGSDARTWDWRLPYYIGFNNFYFLHQNAEASEYLMEAYRRNPEAALLGSLASRLSYEGGRLDTAILFLESLIYDATDESAKKSYEKRLAGLRAIQFLQNAVQRYVSSEGRPPAFLESLVKEGYVDSLPIDPFGGTFFLSDRGEVKTTSGLR